MSKSSIEIEYQSMFTDWSDVVWLRGLLFEIVSPQYHHTPLYIYNMSAIQIATNIVFHERTKDIKVY